MGASARDGARAGGRPVSVLLFTGGGGAASEALFRLLRSRHEVHFADADADAKPAGVPAAYWHSVPLASSSAFVERLTQLCAELAVDLLVPGVDEELLEIAKARATVAAVVLLPPEAFVRTHLDKLESSHALRRAGLPAPDTEMAAARKQVSFPCVVKPRRGRGSRDVAVVWTEEELQAHLVHCRRPAEDFVVQQYLEGQEYTVTMVADHTGALRAVVPVRVARKRGITLRAVTDHDDAVINACMSIHAAFPVSGCFNIQMVKTHNDAVQPFEINPRISTTTCLALAAGVSFVDLYLGGLAPFADARGLAIFRDHVQLKRSWTNEFLDAAGGAIV